MNLKSIIRHRVESRFPLKDFLNCNIKQFYIGGNSLNRTNPNDIDIFPIEGDFDPAEAKKVGTVVCETKNAITVKTKDGVVLQFCNYVRPNLKSLVRSFDFSHIQIGCTCKITESKTIEVTDSYFTKAYLYSKLEENTAFQASEYPLSSLVRSYKYMKRGDFANKSYIWSMFKIITSIVKRGFKDYPDFKNQLDAVDLGLIPEDFKDLEYKELMDLFEALRKDK